MHGRLKVRTSEEEKIRKEKERAKKLVKYQAAMSLIMDKRSKNEFDKLALDVTAEVLSSNPDIYTLWNYRREIILHMSQSETAEDLSKLYDSELKLTETCLKSNPKSYPAWYQRIWVLDSRSDPDWNKELKLCNVYLKLDERNFHCWDYRRHVVSRLGSEDENEFKYSTEKIFENFSNYSSWHYRSRLLTKLYPDPEGSRSIEEKCHRDELELVLNAAFTDPNDSSAWFYQRWLLGAMPQKENLGVVRITTNKSYIAFNQSIPCPVYKVNITVDGNVIDGKWQSLSGRELDVLWILNHNTNLQIGVESKGIVSLQIEDIIKSEVECSVNSDNELIGNVPASFPNIFGASVVKELEKQVESCEQLLKMEPDSKWSHLTLAVIKHSISHIENYESCKDFLRRLIDLDPKRTDYYKDLASRWHIEFFLQTCGDISKSGMFVDDGEVTPIKLSTLYHLQYWSSCTEIHLNNHQLISQCLPKLYVLQNCEVLHLENNCLNSLKGFPLLPKLKTVHLKGNSLSQDDVKYLSLCPDLQDIIFD